jgi:hypothetical protein
MCIFATYKNWHICAWLSFNLILRGRRGRDRMVVGCTTTYAISAYNHKSCEFEPAHDEVYSIQHYVIKIVCDMWQVGSFLRFPQPINLTTTTYPNYCWKWQYAPQSHKALYLIFTMY